MWGGGGGGGVARGRLCLVITNFEIRVHCLAGSHIHVKKHSLVILEQLDTANFLISSLSFFLGLLSYT